MKIRRSEIKESPCTHCDRREVGSCHSVCRDYLKYKLILREIKKRKEDFKKFGKPIYSLKDYNVNTIK